MDGAKLTCVSSYEIEGSRNWVSKICILSDSVQGISDFLALSDTPENIRVSGKISSRKNGALRCTKT